MRKVPSSLENPNLDPSESKISADTTGIPVVASVTIPLNTETFCPRKTQAPNSNSKLNNNFINNCKVTPQYFLIVSLVL